MRQRALFSCGETACPAAFTNEVYSSYATFSNLQCSMRHTFTDGDFLNDLERDAHLNVKGKGAANRPNSAVKSRAVGATGLHTLAGKCVYV